MKKTLKAIFIPIVSIALVITLILIIDKTQENEIESFRKIQSQEEYDLIFSGFRHDNYSEAGEIVKNILTFPASAFADGIVQSPRVYKSAYTNDVYDLVYEEEAMDEGMAFQTKAVNTVAEKEAVSGNGIDYSTTNIQVENVDEADRVKTNGKYIFTINNEVVNVVDASDNNNLKLVKKISMENAIPMDIMLGETKLAVIGSTKASYDQNTKVEVYDIEDDFKLVSSYVYKYNYVEPVKTNPTFVDVEPGLMVKIL